MQGDTKLRKLGNDGYSSLVELLSYRQKVAGSNPAIRTKQRDQMMAEYRNEPHAIDAALEVVNAVTELVET